MKTFICIKQEDLTIIDKNVKIEVNLDHIPRIGEIIWLTDKQELSLEKQIKKSKNYIFNYKQCLFGPKDDIITVIEYNYIYSVLTILKDKEIYITLTNDSMDNINIDERINIGIKQLSKRIKDLRLEVLYKNIPGHSINNN